MSNRNRTSNPPTSCASPSSSNSIAAATSSKSVVAVDYVTRIDELIERALHRTPAADTLAATPTGRAS